MTPTTSASRRSLPAILLTLLLTLSLSAFAQNTGRVSVVHGIPGLPVSAEVCLNGDSLFFFGFGDIAGPFDLPPDDYFAEVKLNGGTVLSAEFTLSAGDDVSAVAHLLEMEGIALSLFVNDGSAIALRNARVEIRHAADAPPVDIDVYRDFANQEFLAAEIGPLANGDPAGPLDVPFGGWRADISLADGGVPVTSAPLFLRPHTRSIVYAVGDAGGGTFTLLIQTDRLAIERPRSLRPTRTAGWSTPRFRF